MKSTLSQGQRGISERNFGPNESSKNGSGTVQERAQSEVVGVGESRGGDGGWVEGEDG